MRPSPPSSTRALEEARARLDESLAKHPDDPTLLLLRGRADERLEQFEDAAKFFQRAAKRLHEQGDRAAEAAASVEAAQAFGRAGALSKAGLLFQAAIAGYELLPDEVSVARTRLAFAKVQMAAKQQADARQQLELTLEPLEAAADWESLGWVNEQLTQIAHDASEPEGALSRARSAVECAAKAKDRSSFGQRLAMVAVLHLEGRNLAKARQYQERAQPYLREAELWLPLLAGYDTLVEVALAEGDRQRAEDLYRDALAVADEVRKPGPQGRIRARWANLVLDRGDAEGAKKLLETAVTQLHAAGDPWESAPAFVALGRACWRLRSKSEALRALDRAESLYRILGDDSTAADVAVMRAEAASGRWAG
jgi:tetratricopeptide (TPR) repeat protein